MKTKVAMETVDGYSLDKVKRGLDEMLKAMGLDCDNPFGSFIKPGMTVLIKPNWAASRWRESCEHKDSLYSVITHPSVIEAVADKVAEALKGKGKIVIADNPTIDADFEELMHFTGIRRLEKKYCVECKIYDLRPFVCKDLIDYGKKDKMTRQGGDPKGEVQINLGKDSLFYGMNPTFFRGVYDEREDTIADHTGERQIYTYAKSVYDADVYISIPKLKTHKKAGVTLNLKGLVGCITQKNQLVHWRVGYPLTGGDEYPDQESYQKANTTVIKSRGAWPGNDTVWRMVVDLYQGMLKKKRSYFSVIDGIIGGEGGGPFHTFSKCANTLIASDDLLLADIAAARFMGIDPYKIKYLDFFIKQYGIDLDQQVQIFIDGKEINPFFHTDCLYKNFEVLPIWSEIKLGRGIRT